MHQNREEIASWPFPFRGFRVSSVPMTSSDMNRLALLYAEVERRLDHRETSSPELEQLIREIAQLSASEEVWFNFDPRGMADVAPVSPAAVRREGAEPRP